MSATIRRQAAAATYSRTAANSQNTANTSTPTITPPKSPGAASTNTPGGTSFTSFSKDAKQAQAGAKFDPARFRQNPAQIKQSKSQAYADKLINLFGSTSTIKLAAAQFTEVMHVLQKGGVISGKTKTALLEVLGMVKKGSTSAEISKKLATIGKDFNKIGNVVTVIAGTVGALNQLQQGNYVGAIKEMCGAATAITFGPARALYTAVIGLARETIPGLKGSIVDKCLSSLDVAEWTKLGVDAAAEVCHQLVNLYKNGRIDIASLDRLVESMKKGGPAFVAKLSEAIGVGMYNVMDKVGKSFAELWVVLNDPHTRMTPSQSGKISAVMGKLSEQMNSKSPAIRQQATKMAKETLQTLLVKAKTDPECKKGLVQWYGYVRSTGSQGYGKYKELLKQEPKQMQEVHTQWRQSSSWLIRLFLGKKAPQF